MIGYYFNRFLQRVGYPVKLPVRHGQALDCTGRVYAFYRNEDEWDYFYRKRMTNYMERLRGGI